VFFPTFVAYLTTAWAIGERGGKQHKVNKMRRKKTIITIFDKINEKLRSTLPPLHFMMEKMARFGLSVSSLLIQGSDGWFYFLF